MVLSFTITCYFYNYFSPERRIRSLSSILPAPALKLLKKPFHCQTFLLFFLDIQHNITGIHHQNTISKIQCRLHIVGDHQTGQLMFFHDPVWSDSAPSLLFPGQGLLYAHPEEAASADSWLPSKVSAPVSDRLKEVLPDEFIRSLKSNIQKFQALHENALSHCLDIWESHPPFPAASARFSSIVIPGAVPRIGS